MLIPIIYQLKQFMIFVKFQDVNKLFELVVFDSPGLGDYSTATPLKLFLSSDIRNTT